MGGTASLTLRIEVGRPFVDGGSDSGAQSADEYDITTGNIKIVGMPRESTAECGGGPVA
jgi:hypothetical protein